METIDDQIIWIFMQFFWICVVQGSNEYQIKYAECTPKPEIGTITVLLLFATMMSLTSVRPKPLFWFRADTETTILVSGRYRNRNPNWQILSADTETDTETTF